jgi:hypothetical protein
VARNPALPRFGRKVRQVDEQLRDLRLRQPGGSLPRARFSIPYDDTFPMAGSAPTTGGYANGYNVAYTQQVEQNDDLAHWDSTHHWVEFDQTGIYLVECSIQMVLFGDGAGTPACPSALWAEGKLQLDTGDRGDLAKDFVSRTGVQAPLSGYQRHPEVIPFNLSGVMLFEAGQNIRILTYLAAPENRVIYGVAGDDPWQPNFDYTYIDLTLTG